jgi:hypothetical protein
MADPVKTPSETPNQPAVETPAAAAATPVAAKAAADPAPTPAQTDKTPPAAKAATPPVTAAKPAEAKPAEGDPKAAADQAAADAATKATADAAAAKAAADADAAKAVADIKYEIKPPEGAQIDPELVPALAPALKKAGLTNEQLQIVADGFMEFQKGVAPRMLARDLELTAKDKEIGGLRYAQTLKEVNIALEAFGDPEFKKFVQTAGIANRLEFVRFVQRIGEAMFKAGDTPVRGEPDAAPATTRAQRLYGGSSKPT